MIYIEFVKESEAKSFVNLIHYNPFDSKEGLGKTEKQLRLTGALIESLPTRETQSGKDAMLYYNPRTREVWYEYVDMPVENTDELQMLKEKMEQQKNAMTEAYDAIAVQSEEIIELRAQIELLKGGK